MTTRGEVFTRRRCGLVESWVIPRVYSLSVGFVSENARFPTRWLWLGWCFTHRDARRRALIWLGEEALRSS